VTVSSWSCTNGVKVDSSHPGTTAEIRPYTLRNGGQLLRQAGLTVRMSFVRNDLYAAFDTVLAVRVNLAHMLECGA
jgi:hypothetical protein